MRGVGCLLIMMYATKLEMKWPAMRVFEEAIGQPNRMMHSPEDITLASIKAEQAMEVWQKIKSGDQSALKTVFDQHYSALCRYALQWTKDPDEAEDIVQRLFVDLWVKRDAIEVELTLKSYLYAATRNRCLNYLKHQRVVQMHVQSVSKAPQPILFMDEAHHLTEAIHKAIANLPDQCGRVFRMVKMEGKRYHEVADELGISVKTIENHMTKALRVLRVELKDFFPLCIGLIIWLYN